jgi:hypothetical protein
MPERTHDQDPTPAPLHRNRRVPQLAQALLALALLLSTTSSVLIASGQIISAVGGGPGWP